MIYILYFFIAIILFTFAYSAIRAIGWVPIWKKDITSVIALADIKEGERFCDLGCGDARLLVAISKKGVKTVGYEVSLFFYIIAKLRSYFSKGKIKIKFRDFWLVDLSDMNVVFLFLIPKIFSKMKNKLEKELKPGSRVITYVWPMEGWKAETVIKRDKRPAIYLYKIH